MEVEAGSFDSFIILFIFSCLMLVFTFLKQNPKNQYLLPPGSMGWPIIGETLAFLKPHKSYSTGSFLQEHCSRYGRVFKSNLFGSPTIVSCDRELNMFIIQNEEKFFKASYPKPVLGILGKFSLLVVSGDIHKRLRNVAVSFIGASRTTPAFFGCVEKLSMSMMESWKECTQISFCTEIRKFTLNLMVKHLLSIEPEEPLALRILEDFQTYMKGFVSLPIYLPGTHYSNGVKARTRLSSIVTEIIRERRKNANSWRVNGEGDFLDVILSKGSLDDDETVSIALDILLGGYETTATLLSLIVYFLAHSPLALQTLIQEHRAIRNSKEKGEPLNLEDYQQMGFTNSIIWEAMRCGNVVKFLHREAITDVKFNEYFIPARWKVLPVFTAVHLDPDIHENPSEFNPWRWDNNNIEQAVMSKKVMPFGGGPRHCPGAELAKVEISFFLHHLVLNYRWRTQADEFPIAYPYVEFGRGLLLEIERNEREDDGRGLTTK